MQFWGCDHIVVQFTTTFAISAYHHVVSSNLEVYNIMW